MRIHVTCRVLNTIYIVCDRRVPGLTISIKPDKNPAY